MSQATPSWPRHVAVIMDGNGRWATQRSLSRIEGHRAGIKSVRSVVESCRRLGIAYLTLYTFSVENWQRPKKEVDELMRLLYYYLTSEIPRFHRKAVRLKAIGQLDRLPRRVRAQLDRIMAKTAKHDRLTLTLALSYGGRTEILDAVAAAARNRAGGREGTEPLTAESFSRFLYAPEIPPPDLLVRTSGEMRLSNFLLWELAHTRLLFVPELWPDFTGARLERIVEGLRAEQASGKRATA